jgi:hypothetical protein
MIFGAQSPGEFLGRRIENFQAAALESPQSTFPGHEMD